MKAKNIIFGLSFLILVSGVAICAWKKDLCKKGCQQITESQDRERCLQGCEKIK